MTRKQRRAGRLVGPCAAVLVIAVGPVASARAQVPQVGEVWWVKAVTLSLRVGSTEKESKLVTYTPPPGWYVRSHWVDCTGRTGRSSFSVHTVPHDWAWLSEEEVKESSKALGELAGKSHGVGLSVKLALEQEALLRGARRVRSTHHALVVDATARGEGLLGRGGCIELTVSVELIYLGTDENLRRAALPHRAKLK
jgi:hypothetical protein